MMKILYTITQGENGGGQKHVLDLATAAAKQHEVYVATGGQLESKDSWLFDRLKDKGFKESNLKIFPHLTREISLSKEFAAFLEIYNFIKNNKFDIVHLHSSKAGTIGSVAAHLAGAKVVYTVHGFVFQEPMNFLKKLFFIASELASSFFIDYHICVSKKDLDIGKKFFIIRHPKKSEVIYNGVENDRSKLLNRPEARNFIFDKIRNKNREIFVFGTIANLYPTKGLEYYIDAAKILKDTQTSDFVCVIFGEGELREKLENKIRENNLQHNFVLLGYTANAYSYLSGLDAFVLPSVKEGLPYALVEASLAELPIIASKVGGIPEMSEFIDMQLVAPKDPLALADKMSDLLKNQNLDIYKSKFSDAFSLSNMTEKTMHVYRKITYLENI